MGEHSQWPAEGIFRIPHWLYPDPEIHAREQARIFGRPNWSYVAIFSVRITDGTGRPVMARLPTVTSPGQPRLSALVCRLRESN